MVIPTMIIILINPHQNDRLAGSTQLDGGGRADGEGELRCQQDV